MSIAQNPLMGPMRKSMGNFTTSSYNGRNVVKSKAFMKKDAKSVLQLAHRLRISLIAGAYQSFGGITNEGFPENSAGKSPYNMFLQANLASAFDPTSEVPVISYPLLQVSKGSIPRIKVTGTMLSDEGITVHFETGLGLPKVSASDEIIAFARLKRGSLRIVRQPRGSEDTGLIRIPFQKLNEEEVECCYLFARSTDGKKVSNSVFVEIR